MPRLPCKLNTGCTADLDDQAKELFKVPLHWCGPLHNSPAVWTTVCNAKWHSGWDFPGSKCCQEVQQLWQGKTGQQIVLQAVAPGISDGTYYSHQLDPAILECVYHDLNQRRYSVKLERSGITAAQVGDAIYIVAVEAIILHFSDSWESVVGDGVSLLTDRCSSGRLTKISNSAREGLWQSELFGMILPVRSSTREMSYESWGVHRKTQHLERCIFLLAERVLAMRKAKDLWRNTTELTEAEDLWYVTLAMMGFHAIQRHLRLREEGKNGLRGLPLRER